MSNGPRKRRAKALVSLGGHLAGFGVPAAAAVVCMPKDPLPPWCSHVAAVVGELVTMTEPVGRLPAPTAIDAEAVAVTTSNIGVMTVSSPVSGASAQPDG